jgi:hypothetical protein
VANDRPANKRYGLANKIYRDHQQRPGNDPGYIQHLDCARATSTGLFVHPDGSAVLAAASSRELRGIVSLGSVW